MPYFSNKNPFLINNSIDLADEIRSNMLHEFCHFVTSIKVKLKLGIRDEARENGAHEPKIMTISLLPVTLYVYSGTTPIDKYIYTELKLSFKSISREYFITIYSITLHIVCM